LNTLTTIDNDDIFLIVVLVVRRISSGSNVRLILILSQAQSTHEGLRRWKACV